MDAENEGDAVRGWFDVLFALAVPVALCVVVIALRLGWPVVVLCLALAAGGPAYAWWLRRRDSGPECGVGERDGRSAEGR